MTLEELLRQGKSFGQGASNAAASTVTGPVDMLAWLLRKGGVPVGDTPIGGEAWMRQKGLMATPENKLAGLLGEGAGLAAPIVAAAKAPEIAGGLLQMGRNLAAPATMNKQTGAIYLPKGGLSSNTDDANSLAEKIKSIGLLPKVDIDPGGSVYVTAYKNNLTKSGKISKRTPEIPIQDFKARFADHPSYWGNSISSDPFTGNTVDDALNQLQKLISGNSKTEYPSVFTKATFRPGDNYGHITDYTTNLSPSLSGKSIVPRTTHESRPFTFLGEKK